MSQPSLERAVELLSRTGSADFERDIGGALTVAITRIVRARSSPAQPTACGSSEGWSSAGRVVVGGRRYRVTMVCERAVLETAYDARVRLRAVDVSEEGAETIMLASRQTLQRPGRMTAIYCQDVVDGDVVDGTIIDLSRLGVTFQTTRLLRRGDRLLPAGAVLRRAARDDGPGRVVARRERLGHRRVRSSGPDPRAGRGRRAHRQRPAPTCRTAHRSTSRRCAAH